MSEFTTCLWFDQQGEEAARFYVDVFPNSSISGVTPYVGGERDGETMTVDFVLNGQKFVALNGGPQFRFDEAISFQIPCADQDEVDRYWSTLTEGGEEGPCGWLKDRFGLSWQVVPNRLTELLASSDPGVAERTAQALFAMKKIVIADLEAAAEGDKQPA
jgi:predicted 3-demethylubiquinone-9 3-methyltransferase (glyoxalase superfamily)